MLHVASQNGDENMIRTLYLARANATVTDEEGELKRTSQTRMTLSPDTFILFRDGLTCMDATSEI